jgi:hypothetical protein
MELSVPSYSRPDIPKPCRPRCAGNLGDIERMKQWYENLSSEVAKLLKLENEIHNSHVAMTRSAAVHADSVGGFRAAVKSCYDNIRGIVDPKHTVMVMLNKLLKGDLSVFEEVVSLGASLKKEFGWSVSIALATKYIFDAGHFYRRAAQECSKFYGAKIQFEEKLSVFERLLQGYLNQLSDYHHEANCQPDADPNPDFSPGGEIRGGGGASSRPEGPGGGWRDESGR